MDRKVREPQGGLSLRTNFSWLSVGRIIHAATEWASIAVLAKLSAIGTVGEFTLALAISAPVVGLANLGLRQAEATDVREEYRFGDYFCLRLFCGFLALLAIGGAIPTVGYGWNTGIVIALVGLARVIDMQSEIFYGLYQSRERLDYVAWSLIIRGSLSLAFLAAGMVMTGQLGVAVMGRVAGSLLVFWCYDLRTGMRLKALTSGVDAATTASLPSGILPIWDSRILARLAWQTLPLGVVSVLSSLHTMLPRYFIERQLGVEELGHFAVMIYIVVGVDRVVGALGSSAVARLARHYANAEARAFVALLTKMAGIGAFFGCLGLLVAGLAGRQILTTLYSPDYAAHADVFVLIMAAAIIRYVATLLGPGVTAARRFRILLAQHAVATAAALAASYWLIGPYGLRGAAFVTVITFTVNLVGVMLINVSSVRNLQNRGRTVIDPGPHPETMWPAEATHGTSHREDEKGMRPVGPTLVRGPGFLFLRHIPSTIRRP